MPVDFPKNIQDSDNVASSNSGSLWQFAILVGIYDLGAIIV